MCYHFGLKNQKGGKYGKLIKEFTKGFNKHGS